MVTDDLVRYASRALVAAADAARARPMAAYMKTAMPFYGVPAPQRRLIAKGLFEAYPPVDADGYRESVLALWSLNHREEKYLAIDYAIRFKNFVTIEHVDLYEQIVTEGAWWDLVDPVASHLIGKVVKEDRERMRPLLEAWIDGDDLWLRRTAILCQLGHKDLTNQAMLFEFCLRRSHEEEFFIRKAIGWALREYARTDPDAVRDFLAKNHGRLSGLSRREAAKHL